MEVTTAARRLTREHNDARFRSGAIHIVELSTGQIGGWGGDFAATQIAEGHHLFGTHALIRIGYGKLSQAEAQRFLNEKGIGW